MSARTKIRGRKVVHQDSVDRARERCLPRDFLDRLSLTYKVLGDPTRLKLIMALREGEMCVCDLAAFLDLTESAVSHHLRRLKDLSLVRPRRDGQIRFYSLNDYHVSELLSVGLAHVRE